MKKTLLLAALLATLPMFSQDEKACKPTGVQNSDNIRKTTSVTAKEHPKFVKARKQNDVRRSAAATTVVGCIISSYDSSQELGIYSIPLDGSDYSLLAQIDPICSTGVLIGDEYITTTLVNSYGYLSLYHEKYNAETWKNIWYEDGAVECMATDMAYDATTGKTYGCFMNYDYDGWQFATFNPEEWWRYEICDLNEPWYGVAVNKDGVLYAITRDGKLYTVNKADGSMSLIGDTGLVADKYTSAVCDPASGDIYYMPMIDKASYLYRINPATAEATHVKSFRKGEQITGLCPLSVAEMSPVPGAVTGLKADFEGNSLSGCVSFKAPLTNADGSPGAGELTYSILLDGTQTASGQTSYGGEVTEPVTVSEAGYHTFTVTVSNAGGNSEDAKLALWIGEQSGQDVIVPPYTNTFEDESSLDGFTTINLNDDDLNWQHSINGWVQMLGSETLPMNAWLITPGIRLENDKFYEVEFDAAPAHSLYPERVEAFFGSAPSPEKMTERLVERTDIADNTGIHLKGYIKTDESGTFYIGIHGCSDRDSYFLRIDNLSIKVGQPASCPSMSTDLTVTPDARGGKSAEISFTTPALDIAGNSLASITKTELYRDNIIIKTFENPAPGTPMKWVDNLNDNGLYTYTVVSYNEAGKGQESKASAYIGINIPGKPADAKVSETATPGEVRITWTAPNTDIDGNPINADMITYTVVDAYTRNIIAEGVSGTEYIYRAISGDNQDFVQYGVFAATEAGTNELAAMTCIYPVGKAYNLPVEESFANGNIENRFVWGNTSAEGSSAWWELLTNDNGVRAQDDDNGYVGCFANEQNEAGYLYTGKINVGDADNPVLSFYYYKFSNCENTVDVGIDAGDGLVSLGTYQCGPENEGWTHAIILLSEYTNKDIRIRFTATSVSHNFTVLDNIRVFDQPECDMAATSIGVPVKADVCNPVILLVDVMNNGSKTVDSYLVELYRNGKAAQTYRGNAIAAGNKQIVAFWEEPGFDSDARVEYYATVTCDGDMIPDNNSTLRKTMLVVLPNYPAPSGLKATGTPGHVELTWSQPDMTDLPTETVTDDFEDYESFAIDNAGDWCFHDGDAGETYGFTNVPFPNSDMPMAYIVFDASGIYDMALAANSGQKSLVSMASYNAPNNDWLISPKLDCHAQYVSFYAKSYVSYYRESFEFLYSTTGNSIGDFKKMAKEDGVPDSWTEYTYPLPAGATYFAIRCTSDDALAFMIDDISYAPADAPEIELELVGYNVYRDGVKLTSTPVTGETYTDNEPATDDYRYYVTAVYDKGESKASNSVTPENTGISNGSANAISVTAGNGRILISGAAEQQINIYTPDGRVVFSDNGSDYTSVSVPGGIYIVKAGNLTTKVLVK